MFADAVFGRGWREERVGARNKEAKASLSSCLFLVCVRVLKLTRRFVILGCFLHVYFLPGCAHNMFRQKKCRDLQRSV